ncbi:Leucyl aminopeptidase (aminopeptidase T) [Halorhabdus sp. SVX81]|uniref:aminopeptidase n=1 Tax=Halorhabdus sp. SVX81 TaxID=2978283 RepID=UPI0023DCD5F2|nr:aminopeptidase [Halorhabdus sp. SVX81]WEL18168.1 Leucyl aminopeptidase (aminopeptidase T) [Halorhabdus sp. SVX81]
MSDSGLRGPAETAVLQCLALDSEESCLIVTDDERRPIGEALYAVASETTDEAMIIQYPPGDQHGEEPPEPVATAMASADVVLAPTTKSLTHTRARTDTTDAGGRVATLPGITKEVFKTGLAVDYEEIRAASERLLEAVEHATELRVTSPEGTDITLQPGDREWQLDTGIVHDPGAMSNLPAGEIFLSPETADGTIVVTGTMAPHGLLEEGHSIRLEVEDGYVTDIDDDTIREQVETAAEEVGEDAYNLAELGIGTNVGVSQLVGSVLLDEKAGGTVHFAVGDDAGIGGDTDAPIHLDGILRNPTVYADGEEIDLPTP